jgi:DNA topoisomerase-3
LFTNPGKQGTDATMAEHIKTIQEREFVVKQQQKLMPTTLGIALVTGWFDFQVWCSALMSQLITGYDNMDLAISLAKPDLRREMEADLKRICDGTKQSRGLFHLVFNLKYQC